MFWYLLLFWLDNKCFGVCYSFVSVMNVFVFAIILIGSYMFWYLLSFWFYHIFFGVCYCFDRIMTIFDVNNFLSFLLWPNIYITLNTEHILSADFGWISFFLQLSKFLQKMQKDGFIKVKELSKGADSVVEIDKSQ